LKNNPISCSEIRDRLKDKILRAEVKPRYDLLQGKSDKLIIDVVRFEF